ncbi:MAG: glycosyltransferase family 4 protein [Candidatus Acidiferrum sp.]
MPQVTVARPEDPLAAILPAGAQPTTIAFIEAGTADGGSVSWLLSALTYLDRSRFQPLIIFYYSAQGATVEKIRALGVTMLFASAKAPDDFPLWLRKQPRFWPLRKCQSLCRIAYRLLVRDASIIRKVRKYLRDERAAAVVLNSDLHLQYCGAVAARLEKLPILCRKSGGLGEGVRIKKLLTPFVDVFVPISKATEKDQLSNTSTKRSVLVYEGVDLSQYRGRRKDPALRAALGLPENKKIVASIARLETGKGQAELIESAVEVLREFPETVFLIVGEETPPNGPITASLRDAVARLGLNDSIVFAGARGDVPDILAISDVFVHCPTTWREGLGICHLEAMASGMPSVISRNGGLPEAAIDGVTGVVVAPGDISAMSRAILRFLTNPDLADEFGKSARARAEHLFDIAANNTIYEHLLGELASRRTRREK